MISNIKIQTASEASKMSVMKGLVGRKISKTVKFMGQDLKINKLMVSEVIDIRSQAAKVNEDDSSDRGLDLIKTVIKLSVEDAEDLSDEDFANLPIDDLTKLSEEIMNYSGLGTKETGK